MNPLTETLQQLPPTPGSAAASADIRQPGLAALASRIVGALGKRPLSWRTWRAAVG